MVYASFKSHTLRPPMQRKLLFWFGTKVNSKIVQVTQHVNFWSLVLEMQFICRDTWVKIKFKNSKYINQEARK